MECGRYAADLPLWAELAREADGPVLDVGAGTGRVALRLAAAGHDVTALDRDAELLGVLRERAAAAGLRVRTVVADAAGFDAGERAFALVAVPMQTIQLLPGTAERGGFFASARRAVAPGGLVALAIAEELESFEDEHADAAPRRRPSATAGGTSPSRRRSASGRRARGSSACGTRSRPAGSAPARRT